MFEPIKLIRDSIGDSIRVKEELRDTCTESIMRTGLSLVEIIRNNGKLLLCGNGGSAADAQHLAAELVIRYRSSVQRRAIAAIALTVDPSIATAGGNDIGFENVFARQVEALGRSGDALIGISTSGNSPNVVNAIRLANNMGITTIGLLGGKGGILISEATHSVVVPSDITARIQESHILVGHIWCEIIEDSLFGS